MRLVTRRLTAPLLLFGALTAACASGPGTVAKADVEKKIAETATEANKVGTSSVSCVGDLEATVGATVDCQVVYADGPAVYPATAKVTSVEGSDVGYEVNVSDTPRP